MKERFVVASILIVCVTVLLLFADQPFFQYIVALSVGSLAAIGVWEYGQLIKAKGGKIQLPILVPFTMLQVLSFFVAAKQPDLELASFVFFLGMLLLFLLHFRQTKGAIIDMAGSCFALIYIAVPMGMLLSILYSTPMGKWWALYLLVVTKVTDIAAYFTGNLWGRKKLVPHISPAKTVEGALCGLFFAIVASYLFFLLSQKANGLLMGGKWLLLGVILGALGQLGDLAESVLKRDANKKDSNRVPGLGGVLDALDSLLFNIPIIYFYLMYFQ